MPRIVVVPGLIVLGLALSLSAAAAQTPDKEQILRSLADTTVRTRSLAAPITRRIEVVGATPDRLLDEVKGLPSVNIRVLFAFDSDRLTPEGESALKPLGEALRDPRLNAARVLIGGHTDIAGGEDHNQGLSDRRAEAVRRFLVQAYGLDGSKLEAKGFGFRKLADPSRPRDGVNRRVEIVNLSP